LIKELSATTNFNIKISKFINEIYRTGVYSDCMKIGKVVPIHKGKEKNLKENYRLITIPSNINKIIEKSIYEIYMITWNAIIY
jgi:hypothetical protein